MAVFTETLCRQFMNGLCRLSSAPLVTMGYQTTKDMTRHEDKKAKIYAHVTTERFFGRTDPIFSSRSPIFSSYDPFSHLAQWPRQARKAKLQLQP